MENSVINSTPNISSSRSMSVEECAHILGVGKAAMYTMVKDSLANDCHPFAVLRTSGKLLVSRKSFFAYLDSIGF